MAVARKGVPADDGKRQILSLTGGGFMGLFTASLLAKAEGAYGRVFDRTDLFAGTSIGAVIALGLAADVPAATIRDAMVKQGSKVFPKSVFPLVGLVQNFGGAAYNAKPLRSVIEAVIGGRKLGELKRRVIIPAVSLTDGGVRLFRGGIDGPDADTPAVDVALASAAAPTYFPVHAIGSALFADGGLISNAPDAVAATEALTRMAGRRGSVRMMAVGTTRYSPAIAGDKAGKNWGHAQWVKDLRLLKFSMAAQVDLARKTAIELLGQNMVLVVDPLLTTEQNKVVGLDDADEPAIETLDELANAAHREILEKYGDKQFMKLWRAHKVRPSRTL